MRKITKKKIEKQKLAYNNIKVEAKKVMSKLLINSK
jgi:hypothetical protein